MSTKTERILPTLQELRDNGESDPEASLIFQALGASSVCWEKMEGTGVFNSDRAKRIGDELLFELGSRSLAQPPSSDLIDAAQAVVERWDSPLWKDLPHTGEFINRLREALAAHPKSLKGIVLEPTTITENEALQLIRDGNRPLFVSHHPKDPVPTVEKIMEAVLIEVEGSKHPRMVKRWHHNLRTRLKTLFP